MNWEILVIEINFKMILKLGCMIRHVERAALRMKSWADEKKRKKILEITIARKVANIRCPT